MNENFSASWYANNTKNKAQEIIVFKKHYNYTVTILYIITFPEPFFLNFSGMFRKAMIKPENDRKAEICRTWPTFALLPLGCPLSTKSEDYLSVWGCRWQEDIKNGFFLKKNHFTTQISRRFASYRHFDGGNSD